MIIKKIDDILGKGYSNSWLSIDLWSIIHFFSGAILAIFIGNWLIALGILVGYEIIEMLLEGVLFYPESWVDIFWDVLIGMGGYFLMKYIMVNQGWRGWIILG